MTKDKTTLSKKPSKKTDVLNEDADFSNHLKKKNQTKSQRLPPHERDESAGPASTEEEDGKRTRKVIKKAHEDVRRGLVDTDRRGIPSDIIESEIPAADDIPNVPGNEKDRKH
tara:strand:- start:1376 stop:1714 length:339 start_codon:yes stop_codon:yes gene_type:complete